jgi:hypothetical protein
MNDNQLLKERLQELIENMPGSARGSTLAGQTYASTQMEKHDA